MSVAAIGLRRASGRRQRSALGLVTGSNRERLSDFRARRARGEGRTTPLLLPSGLRRFVYGVTACDAEVIVA